jgi:ABC-type transport system substrate-binding protein
VEFGTSGIQTVGRLLYCGFNLSLRRFQNPEMRRAASLAIDRAELVRQVFAGGAEPATGIVPPTFPGSRADVCGDACTPAVEEARAVVEALPVEDRTFSIDYAESDTGALVATALAEQLGEAGFVASPRGHTGADYAELLSKGEQAFFCLTAVADYPRQRALLEPLLHSASPDNRTGIDDPELDDLLERARSSFDPIQREDLYLQAERRGLELMPLVPIAWFREHFAAKPFVGGFAVDAMGIFDVASLSIGA